MSPPLAIFADASNSIGFGHLTRMRTLQKYLGCSAVVITRTRQAAAQVFDSDDCELREISEIEDIQVGSRALPMPANVILDPPYAEGLEGELDGPYWQPIVDSLRAAGCRVARFTDEAVPSKVNCDLLVNDHPRAAGFKTAYESFGFAGRLLAGPEYFLIDAGHKIPATVPVSAEESLFVSFGGADQLGLVERFEAGLREICTEIRTNLVIGPGSAVVEFDIPNLNVHRAVPPAEFAGLLRRARMAVTASGNTMFERVFHGVPGLSVSQSAHQQDLGEEFEGFGVTRHLGRGDTVSADWFAASVRALWNDDTALHAQGEACRSMDVEGGCRAIVEAVAAL